ncbi:hypothetical protein MPER_00991, partial [Moniliophthora perniciosa FA553]
YNMIRGITGIGEGKGPYVSIHDGFGDVNSWNGFLPGSDRFMMDSHPYFAFSGDANNAPIATGSGLQAGGPWPLQACNAWGPSLNRSRTGFGVTIAGEFNNGYNDCGLFLKSVPGIPHLTVDPPGMVLKKPLLLPNMGLHPPNIFLSGTWRIGNLPLANNTCSN